MDWQTFIFSILGSGAVTALVNGLMNHRTRIRVIKESGLYTKRADVLDELMKRMERLDRIMQELISPMQSDNSNDTEIQRRQDSLNAYKYLYQYFKRSRHYLSRDLSNEIEKLCIEYKNLFIRFSFEARIIEEKPNVKLWNELNEKIRSEMQIQKERVAEEFRKIIGVR